jgi:GNAT superfamily N-acetyltransferase
MLTFVSPDSPRLWAEARRLVREYAASLGVDLSFQDFDREIASLEHEYGPPDGHFLLAADDDRFVGCGGFRRLTAADCEMKRLYVVSSARGTGAGRALAVALIAEARRRGYQAMLLDTLPSMQGAQRLYASLGFAPTTPYRFNPVEGTSFLRLPLTPTDLGPSASV